METEERLLEMRGMRRQEIIDYFMGLEHIECNLSTFVGEHWSAEVREESFVSIGSLLIPSTIVIFKGEKSLESVIYSFRLRFLTAGG
ncbi:MAG: hypothetical protein CVU84_01505 [Firmicutes bacterium HGW-Firmicutes-1]|jgi:hypothetical protein|nr:MAG: hypothetical protein CVU84_01505 [Firmicutes bacterium HGW-Firmicutes-1]